MMLLETVRRRLGSDAVEPSSTVVDTRDTPTGVVASVQRGDGRVEDVTGDLLIGADGIHSRLRAKFYPDEGPPRWGGAILWRGTALASRSCPARPWPWPVTSSRNSSPIPSAGLTPGRAWR